MLIPDWKEVLKKAWSIRLVLLAAGLGGLELLLQYITPDHPPKLFIIAGVCVNMAAAVARVVAQPKLSGHVHED